MAASFGDYVLDNGLTVLDTLATAIYICSAEPTTFTEATVTFALGNKTGSAGSRWGSPADATPNGRKVASVAITDGSVTANGTATHWATVDGTRLLAHGPLSTSFAVVNGGFFSLASFNATMPAT